MSFGDAKLVQFMHPGSEHRPDRDRPDWKGWNTGDHRRKFLRSNGRYRPGVTDDEVDGELCFWGEWEAQAEVRRLPAGPTSEYPRWVHSPRLQPRLDYMHAQNTDPFVFGGRFLYTCCKQRLRSGRPTQLRSLLPGSLILFGSHVNGGFTLDTAFVVADHLDHHKPDDLDGLSDAYVHTTIRPMYEIDADYCDPMRVGWRLYRGARADDRCNGMFSFVPARTINDGAVAGFPRPHITLDGLITASLRQGQKLTPLDAPMLRMRWEQVVDQVLEQGLVLATAFECPPVERMTADSAGRGSRCC